MRISNEVYISHVFLIFGGVHAHNRVEFSVRNDKVDSCENLSELFWRNFISSIAIPILEELLYVHTGGMAEGAKLKKKRI